MFTLRFVSICSIATAALLAAGCMDDNKGPEAAPTDTGTGTGTSSSQQQRPAGSSDTTPSSSEKSGTMNNTGTSTR